MAKAATKVAVSIPDDLYRAVERARRKSGKTRSAGHHADPGHPHGGGARTRRRLAQTVRGESRRHHDDTEAYLEGRDHSTRSGEAGGRGARAQVRARTQGLGESEGGPARQLTDADSTGWPLAQHPPAPPPYEDADPPGGGHDPQHGDPPIDPVHVGEKLV